MKNYEQRLEDLLNGLSDYAFDKVKEWIPNSFSDVTEGFDENFYGFDDYLKKLRCHIDYLEDAYKIHQTVFNTDRKTILSVFDLNNEEVQKNINDSLDNVLQDLHELFIDFDVETGTATHLEMDEDSRRDMELIGDFLNA